MILDTQRRNIIFIDSETGLFAGRMKDIFRDEAVELICVFSFDARAVLEEVRPDLLLMNGDISKAAALGVIEHVRRRHPRAPIILILSGCESLHSGMMERLGISDYVYNTFEKEMILRKITRYLERKEGCDDDKHFL
ncbi:MAG: hypothetical protein JW844_03590 [Candidatus Omnitrophica bacterium]|nr:hypothetical protein [Candidatus Omnitrophota bacterium]